jgi:hypothetical protein
MASFEESFSPTPTNPTDTTEPEPAVPAGPTVAPPWLRPRGQDGSTGKHFLIVVPDFTDVLATNPANVAPMNSYLRLGAAHSEAGPATAAHGLRYDLGEDLASLVLGFTDDSRDRGSGSPPAGAPDLATGAATPEGYAYGSPPSTASDIRQWESKQLHTKGGWRDHSDGNRITTTRGDKIEVIRGNYKLLVLGRTDDIGNAVGMDMSGGQVDTDSSDLAHPTAAEVDAGVSGLNMTWEWRADSHGQYRWHVTTLQGNAMPSGPGPVDHVAGTDTAPSMTTTTWAYDVFSTTNANSVTTNVTTQGDNVSKTTSGGGLRTTTTASGAMNTVVTAGTLPRDTTVPDATVAGDMTSKTTSAGAMNTVVTAGVILNRAPLATQAGDMSTTTASAGGMNALVHAAGLMSSTTSSIGDMSGMTSSAAAMNTVVTAGTVANFAPAATNAGDMSATTASVGAMNTLIHAGGGMTNTTSAGGTMTNNVSAETMINHQDSKFQLDVVSTAFHMMMEVSATLMDIKPFVHADIHNIHFDCHFNHLDFHLGAHVTLDMARATEIPCAGKFVAAAWYMYL